METSARQVQLGVIGAPHGVKGEVRVKSFTADPMAIGDYGPLSLDDGRTLSIVSLRPQGDMLVVRFDGVTTREQAAGLTNRELHVERAVLPEIGDEDEFYHADLVGLAVVDETGEEIGKVVGLQDFGAGDILEIRLGGGRSVLIPFTRAAVPVIDLSGGRVVVDRIAAGLVESGEDR
jgi:16S rRNA processing protein RimM